METPPARTIDLAPFAWEELERMHATVFAVDEAFRLCFVNAGWYQFARANGACWAPGEWDLGCSVLAALPASMREPYVGLFEQTRVTGSPIDLDYVCASPDEMRFFCARIYPLDAGGYLTVHSLVSSAPAVVVASDAAYCTDGDFVVVCSSCQRLRRMTSDGAEWDWVPAYVQHPRARTSHGLCAVCAAFHFKL